ncbi:cupredoxin domain-containing protein [Rhodococcus sp. T2V]|uniref:cupredoxin domain-containing protein n=1 Tax=Rhodococcus sp. T2V TaxID=3034164 RepID=UPI0023E17F4B|nr:cupredoxin domain-containing protein [Rhodococcus sp. T2V]MDF3311944.1 cupredoxin domain-containing protein [Rhodococcus sp. T2V]
MACSSSGSGTSASSVATSSSAPSGFGSGPGAAATISIEGYSFATPIGVGAGAPVIVENVDTVEHSVTADSGDAFDRDVAGGGTVVFTAPTQSGSYPFHCTYHPGMHGVLVVVPLHPGRK